MMKDMKMQKPSFLNSLKKNPDHKITDIYRLLSYIYYKTEKWEKVLNQSKRIIQLDQEDLEAHKYAIMANFKLERYEDARKTCKQLFRIWRFCEPGI